MLTGSVFPTVAESGKPKLALGAVDIVFIGMGIEGSFFMIYAQVLFYGDVLSHLGTYFVNRKEGDKMEGNQMGQQLICDLRSG